ncbi:MAG TPA: hypothetical protein VK462_03950, partial [Nitrososphaeraceae archaeon]|nr:hypothetical protein [Nitrososphaeraceae archaeon]
VVIGMLTVGLQLTQSPEHDFWMTARAHEEDICTRTLNSNTKYVIAFALAILVHRTARYLHTSKDPLVRCKQQIFRY